MPAILRPHRAGALLLAALPLVAGCSIDVREHQEGKRADVDIRSPLGSMSVRTDVEHADTGLPAYPNARRLDDEREPENADVTLGNRFFGLKVVAAKFETDDTAEQVVAYYREQMQTYGAVTECRGDVDFRRGRVHCRERGRSGEIQLVTGTESRHRIVSVKPRTPGSEFAVVYIQTNRRG